MKQTSLTKNQRTQMGEPYMNLMECYVKEVQKKPKNQKPNLHIFSVNTDSVEGHVCPIEFANQEVSLLNCADRGLIHFDETDKRDIGAFVSLEKLIKGSLLLKKDCVLFVVDGFIVSTVHVVRKQSSRKSVSSGKGFG